jgi:uncharacterized membrane protein YozB (DUF420 family)
MSGDWVAALPAVDALLNGVSALFLSAGFFFIRSKNVASHRRMMLAACATSVLFLICYVTYHSTGRVTRFHGSGAWRPLYFSILISHVILAATIVPLVLVTVSRGLRMRIDAHRRIARVTLPIWMYVSVTGVLVYLFLYRWFA